MKLIGKLPVRIGLVAALVAGLLAGCTPAANTEATSSTPVAFVTTPTVLPPTKTVPQGPEASLDQSVKPDKYHCGNGGNDVLLVFDDFARSKKLHKQLIDTAKKNDIGIGVAPNGEFVKSGRVNVGYARKKGMFVVDHAFDHNPFMSLPVGSPKVKGSLVWEITRPYNGSNFVRPPYGSPFFGKNTKARKAAKARVNKAFKDYDKVNCLWNLDPEDWNHKSPKAAADYIIKHAFKGATAVVHENHLGTQPKLLKYIKDGLAKRGLKLCRPWSTATPKKMPNRYC